MTIHAGMISSRRRRDVTVPSTAVPTDYVVTTDDYSVPAGTPIPIEAQLRDENGDPLALGGRLVTWSKTGSGGSFSAATSYTDADGIASIVFTVGSGVTHTVTATDASLITGTSANIIAASAGGFDHFDPAHFTSPHFDSAHFT